MEIKDPIYLLLLIFWSQVSALFLTWGIKSKITTFMDSIELNRKIMYVLFSFILAFWLIILGIFFFKKANVISDVPESKVQEKKVGNPD